VLFIVPYKGRIFLVLIILGVYWYNSGIIWHEKQPKRLPQWTLRHCCYRYCMEFELTAVRSGCNVTGTPAEATFADHLVTGGTVCVECQLAAMKRQLGTRCRGQACCASRPAGRRSPCRDVAAAGSSSPAATTATATCRIRPASFSFDYSVPRRRIAS